MTQPLPNRTLFRVPLACAALALAGCFGSSDSASITAECSVAGQNQAIYNVMQQWYLWYEELPELDPTQFASQDALIDALRFQPVDRFSFINPAEEEQAFFGFGQFVGLGFRNFFLGDQVLISDVFEDSPAAAAGMERGGELLAVDGVLVADLLAEEGAFSAALGPAEIGVEVRLQFRNRAGENFDQVLTKEVVTIPPTTAVNIFEIDGTPTGYLVFRNFVEPGVPALNAAFAEFQAAGVTQLIVDVRYNGGGLVSVLEHFADLLGSRTASNQPFARYLYNDKNSNRNQTFFFAATPPSPALELEQIVFITTASTASASEMLVNGMLPYVNTATVGAPTFGKPVGQLGFRICENIFRPVSFATVNGVGAGDFFDGIPVNCPAVDTIEVPFGAVGEASFDTAVHWLQHGFCPQPAPEAMETLEMRAQELERERPMWRLNDAW